VQRAIAEDLLTDRHRRGPFASPLRFKPPPAVLLIELVQHAVPLCPSHPGLDPASAGLAHGDAVLARTGRRPWKMGANPHSIRLQRRQDRTKTRSERTSASIP
jgi:hypothetical protein